MANTTDSTNLREQYNNYTPHTIGELWSASKTRDAVCDEFIEEAKRAYSGNEAFISCVESIAEKIRSRG